MKKLLFLLFIAVSCAKFHYAPVCSELNVVLNVEDCVITADYETELLYDWDESKYGKIINNDIDTSVCIVFDSLLNVVSTAEIENGQEYKMAVKYPNTYNVVVRNKTRNTIYSVEDGKYVSETGYLHTEPYFKYTEPAGIINQCEEQYADYNENILSVINETWHTDWDMAVKDDNTYSYTYKIYKRFQQISYVYLVQIVVIDDIKTIPMIVDKCTYIGMCGVSESSDIMSNNDNKRGTIECFDVKPFQFYSDYAVCCSKIITYGLPATQGSSWGDDKKCELGIELVLINGIKKRGKLSIGSKLADIPYGGIITVAIKNSVLYDGGTYINSGIDPTVEEWGESVFDVPF